MGTLINQTYPLGNKGKQRSLILTNNVVNNSIVFDLKKNTMIKKISQLSAQVSEWKCDVTLRAAVVLQVMISK